MSGLLVGGSEGAQLSALDVDLVLVQTLPLMKAALVNLVDLARRTASHGLLALLVVVCVEGIAHNIIGQQLLLCWKVLLAKEYIHARERVAGLRELDHIGGLVGKIVKLPNGMLFDTFESSFRLILRRSRPY